MKNSIKYVLVLNGFLLAATCFGQVADQSDEKAIISWIEKHAVPIRHLEAGNGYEDLQPLKEMLKDVKVVGLGEATHGTREFFQIKHRLLEFLVNELGYTGFAIEAPYFACKPINDYILHGEGDLSSILTGQGYVVWDTEEMVAMIQWMRSYNQHLPVERQVKFYGLDLAYQEIGRKEVLSYLERVAPDWKLQTDSIFRILAKEEEKWPMQKDGGFDKLMLTTLPSIQTLMDYLVVNKEPLVKKSSSPEFEQALHNLRVMRQFIFANTPALKPPFIDGVMVRSLSMAENLIYLVDQAGPDAKFVVWEHNSHIAKNIWKETNLWRGTTLMGYQLRKKYGEKYYAIGLEVNQGSYQTRLSVPPNLLGDLKSIPIPPAPVDSWPWYLSQSTVENFLIDFRKASYPTEVEAWINAPQQLFLTGWVHDPQRTYAELEVGRLYDGIIHIRSTNPTRPTTNALKTAAAGKGL
ncbi:erythromycin esterase family protein [Cyclobacterium salsum]|uniref:erythromycin esterase family protein n=1 Tax=Cyclobacterium salsum TaxID=2666329 RepID=UPI001391C3AF|nr:erythromycin esterase family protein [Cyclobacterium salsum]